MFTEVVMSALSRINGNRVQGGSNGAAYGDLRDKVASLIRPEKPVATTAQPLAHPVRLRPTHDEAPAAAVKLERPETIGRELGSAFEILSRATSCFDLLTQKLDQTESERDEAQAQLDEQKRAALAWQEMIETVQARLRDAERDLLAMRQEMAAQQDRARIAEERAEQLENALNQRERRLMEVEENYSNLHDQVMSSFGLNSPTYRNLENLVDRFHARAA